MALSNIDPKTKRGWLKGQDPRLKMLSDKNVSQEFKDDLRKREADRPAAGKIVVK